MSLARSPAWGDCLASPFSGSNEKRISTYIFGMTTDCSRRELQFTKQHRQSEIESRRRRFFPCEFIFYMILIKLSQLALVS